jgi:hypothetical protein
MSKPRLAAGGGRFMKCSMKHAICSLRAAGWRIYLNGQATAPGGVPWDFLPWNDDDLIPLTDVAGRALRSALAGDPAPSRDCA